MALEKILMLIYCKLLLIPILFRYYVVENDLITLVYTLFRVTTKTLF